MASNNNGEAGFHRRLKAFVPCPVKPSGRWLPNITSPSGVVASRTAPLPSVHNNDRESLPSSLKLPQMTYQARSEASETSDNIEQEETWSDRLLNSTDEQTNFVIHALRRLESQCRHLAAGINLESGLVDEETFNKLSEGVAMFVVSAVSVGDEEQDNFAAMLRRGVSENEPGGMLPNPDGAFGFERLPRKSSGEGGNIRCKDFFDWFLACLPEELKLHGVYYGPLQLREVLLKCSVLVQHLLRRLSDRTATTYEVSALNSILVGIVSEESLMMNSDRASPQSEKKTEHNKKLVEEYFGEAFFVLFLYTVDAKSFHGCEANEALRHLQEVWERLQLRDDSKLPTEQQYKRPSCFKKLPLSRIQPREANRGAQGWNTAIWALANWSLRVRNDPTQHKHHLTAEKMVRCLQPFIDRLQAALFLLPSTHATVFRGITGTTTTRYKQGQKITWAAFSSTSTEDKEALAFMGKQKGVFFSILTHGARDIGFVSWFPRQAEKLVPAGTPFTVQSRVSDTLLLMLESPAELVTMKECAVAGRPMVKELSPDEAAGIAVIGASKTVFIYDNFLDHYVKGRVGPSQFSDVGAIDVKELSKRLSSATPSRYALVGDGGTGKTCAMLYLVTNLSRLAAKAPWDDPIGKKKKHRHQDSHQSVPFPIFVPLPAVTHLFEDSSSILSFVLQLLGIDQFALEALSCRRSIVLLLDSLDEVRFPSNDLEQDAKKLFVSSGGNAFLATLVTHIVISTRPVTVKSAETLLLNCPEPRASKGTQAAKVTTLFAKLFREADKMEFLRIRTPVSVPKVADSNEEKEDHVALMVRTLKAARVWDLSSTPFLLHLAIETRNLDPTTFDRARQLVNGGEHNLRQGIGDEIGNYGLYEAFFDAWSKDQEKNLKSTSQGGPPPLSAEDFIRIAEDVASELAIGGVSAEAIGDIGRYRVEAIKGLLRIESMEYSTLVSFRHKSLQDFLVARKIYVECIGNESESSSCNGTASSSSPPKLTPLMHNCLLARLGSCSRRQLNVFTLLGSRLMRDTRYHHTVCSRLGATIAAYGGHKDPASVSLVSNALAMLARNREPIAFFAGRSAIAGGYVTHANLEFADFRGLDLRCTTFNECVFRGADFSYTSMAGMRLPGAVIGQLPPLEGHQAKVTTVSISSNGQTIVTGSEDGCVKLWSAENSEEICTLEGHRHQGEMLNFSHFTLDNEFAVTGSINANRRSITLWNINKKTAICSLDSIAAFALSPVAPVLVSIGAEDGGAVVWNVTHGTQVARFMPVHLGSILSAAFSPDGAFVAFAGSEGHVALWSFKEEEKTRLVFQEAYRFRTVHQGAIYTVSFSPTSHSDRSIILASAGEDCTARILSTHAPYEQEQEGIVTLSGHKGPVRCIAWSPDGRIVVTGSDDTNIHLWSSTSGALLSTLSGHVTPITTLLVSPEGNSLSSLSSDTNEKFWNIATAESPSLTGHCTEVHSVEFSPDGRLLITGIGPALVKLWIVKLAGEVKSLPGHTHQICAVAYHPHGKMIATGSVGTTALWNAESVAVVGRKETPTAGENIVCLSFSPESCSRYLASVARNARVRVLDLESNLQLTVPQEEQSSSSEFWSQVACVQFRPKVGEEQEERTCLELAIGGGKGEVQLWNFCTRSAPEVIPFTRIDTINAAASTAIVHAIAFNCDGKFLATATSGNSFIQIIAVEEKATHSSDSWMKLGEKLSEHTAEVRCLAWSRTDPTILASGGEDNTVKIWKMKTGGHFSLFKLSHAAAVTALQFSPNNAFVVTGSSDKTVRLWSITLPNVDTEVLDKEENGTVPRCALIRTLLGHRSPVACVDVSPNSETIISSSLDATVQFWHVNIGHDETGSTVNKTLLQFSKDRRYLKISSDRPVPGVSVVAIPSGSTIEPVSHHSPTEATFSVSKGAPASHVEFYPAPSCDPDHADPEVDLPPFEDALARKRDLQSKPGIFAVGARGAQGVLQENNLRRLLIELSK